MVAAEEEEEEGASMVDHCLLFIYFDLIQLFVVIVIMCVCVVVLFSSFRKQFDITYQLRVVKRITALWETTQCLTFFY